MTETAAGRTTYTGRNASSDAAGMLYMNWLFEPGTPDEVVEDIYMPHLNARILRGDPADPKGARVIWLSDDEITARVMTAGRAGPGAV